MAICLKNLKIPNLCAFLYYIKITLATLKPFSHTPIGFVLGTAALIEKRPFAQIVLMQIVFLLQSALTAFALMVFALTAIML